MPDATTAASFKQARAALGDELPAVARRAGVAERVARAMEDGRFEALPRGLYARAAVRSYAAALGLDPVETLRECELLLPPVEEPIRGMGRLKGMRSPAHAPAPTDLCEPRRQEKVPALDWRPCAAAALDATLIGAILPIVIAGAAVTARVRIDALAGGEGAFGVVAMVLAGVYFIFFGGLSGTTAGARAVGLLPFSRELSPLHLRAILARAGCCAGSDLAFMWTAGRWVGRLGAATAAVGSASKQPSAPRADVWT